jgi:ribosomal protein S18 acetylase RimI-like enzyme
MNAQVTICPADESIRERFTEEIGGLVHATAPVSYDYHFPKRAIFDHLTKMSWLGDGSLFAADATHLALKDDQLLGIEIGFPGTEWKAREAALGPLWSALLENGLVIEGDLEEVLINSDHASWLNPVVPSDIYYVHALSVKSEARGQKVGMRLLSQAMSRAKALGFRGLQLDVLSDNPAVNFYQSMGLELLVESLAPKPNAAGVPAEYRMGIIL